MTDDREWAKERERDDHERAVDAGDAPVFSDTCELSLRAERAVKAAARQFGVEEPTWGFLAGVSTIDFLRIPNVGRRTVDEIQRAIKHRGLGTQSSRASLAEEAQLRRLKSTMREVIAEELPEQLVAHRAMLKQAVKEAIVEALREVGWPSGSHVHSDAEIAEAIRQDRDRERYR